MREAFACVASTADATVSKMGMPWTSCPALPGVTPATTFVPYSRLRSEWKDPSFPVKPCTTTRVSSSMRIAIALGLPFHRKRRGLFGRLEHRCRRNDPLVRRIGENLAALLRIRPVEPNDDRNPRLHPPERFDDSRVDEVATRDAAEDVHQHRLHLRIGKNHLERRRHQLRARTT